MPPTQLHHPSPKRKRDQAPLPLLSTPLRNATTPPRGSPAPSPGPDSPRNAVADQLRGMTLTSLAAIPLSPLSPADDVAHKKPKLDEKRPDSGITLREGFVVTKTLSWGNGKELDTITLGPMSRADREIPETPQAPQPRILPDIASFAQPTTFTSFSGSPAPQQLGMSPSQHRTQHRSSSQPRPRNTSPSPPLSALTWQDSEITGHLVDPSIDPEDDGTGLNGIGFKPTPAIAYARSQKRRQQLNEWKARETREARAKRSERRRRGIGSTASREVTVEREMPAKELEITRRTVKFAI